MMLYYFHKITIHAYIDPFRASRIGDCGPRKTKYYFAEYKFSAIKRKYIF